MDSVLFVNLRPYQLEANAVLVAARRAGLRVALLADRVPPGALSSLIDDVEIVDTYQVDAARRAAAVLAGRERVRGVVTWSDRDVELVALIAADLGLPGPSVRAAHLVRNKYAGRLAFAARPDLIPRFALVDDAGALDRAIAEVGLPAVLKPLTGSGSKGVFEVADRAAATAAWQQLRDYTTGSGDPMFAGTAAQWLLEERLDGTEHSVEGLVQAGVVHIVAITDKITTVPYHLEVEHVQPSALEPDPLMAVHALTRAVIEVLGFDDGAFHLECKVDEQGRARLVEINGRAAGGMIASHLVPLATGVDFCRDVIRVAVGLPVPPPPPATAAPTVFAGARSVFADRAGMIEDITGLSDALTVPGVDRVAVLLGRGARTLLPPDDFMSQRVLTAIAHAGDRKELRSNLLEACSAISVRISSLTDADEAAAEPDEAAADLAAVAAEWDGLQRVRSMDEARGAVLGPDFVGQHSNVTPHYLSALANRLGLGPQHRVLDAGSGTGGLSLALAARTGCEVVGVDLSPAAVDVARERLARHPEPARLRFAVGDLATLPEETERFDAILSFGSSYWSATSVTVRRWRELLRDGGSVVMLLTRIHAPRSARDSAVGLQSGLFTPHADWEGALTRAGFTVSVNDISDLDGLYFRAYLTQLQAREADLCAEMGGEAGANYIGMFEQFLSYYDRGLLSRLEITATLAG